MLIERELGSNSVSRWLRERIILQLKALLSSIMSIKVDVSPVDPLKNLLTSFHHLLDSIFYIESKSKQAVKHNLIGCIYFYLCSLYVCAHVVYEVYVGKVNNIDYLVTVVPGES